MTTSTTMFMPSRWRRVFCSLFFAAAAVAAVGAFASSRTVSLGGFPLSGAHKIAPWVMEHTANGQKAEFFVVLTDQADLSQAANLPTEVEKGRYVYNTLLDKSRVTQKPILQWLRERGLEYRSFYIVNAVLVKGSREIAEALVARPDVARIEGNPLIHNELPQPAPAVEALQPQALKTIEPGIAYTHAPDVWALGFTGQEIVVGSLDSGVRWTHNALKPHYRGWDGTTADHDYNWHDAIHVSDNNPCGTDSPEPCDDLGHGSHTTGTMIGDDGAGNQIGMAPGARWIACRGLDGRLGTTTPSELIECMEFFLAPYPVGGDPTQGDPTKAPDITNNSWGCPPELGCSVETLQAAVEAQAAAGIVMVASAGNDGPGCSTVDVPPGIYDAVYTVGALVTNTDMIDDESGRGPVIIDASNRLKPDITAPGTDIRSASNKSDTAYESADGTSMAAPHIAGAMALLWSAKPAFRHDIARSRDALNNRACHILDSVCDGGPAVTPNNTYGYGRVDILAAVNPIPSPSTDFNHDGKPDYVLYAASTHQSAVWYLNNNVFLGSAYAPTLPAGWNVIDVADFNGDGNPDYALFNSSAHQTAIWYLSGVTRIGSAYGPILPNGWELEAVGNFNADCKPDYVLYAPSTHQTAVWYLNNNTRIGSAYGPTLPAGWRLAGVADFNGDGNPDYGLFNSSAHQTAIWYFSGVTRIGSAYGPTLPSPWALTGTADFNRDGSPDYVLYNPSTGQTALWYLNNNVFVSSAYGPTLPAGWSLTAP
jgi:serine protease AprX